MIILSHDQHLDEIMSARPSYRERLRDLDERILDILYEDQLRHVAHAMSEPQPRRPIDKTVAAVWAGALALNFAFIGFGGLMIWQMLR